MGKILKTQTDREFAASDQQLRESKKKNSFEGRSAGGMCRFDSSFTLKTKHTTEAATHHHGLITVKSVHVRADLGVEPEAIMMRVDNRKCDAKALLLQL